MEVEWSPKLLVPSNSSVAPLLLSFFSCLLSKLYFIFPVFNSLYIVFQKGNVPVSSGGKFTYTVAATHSNKYDPRPLVQAGRHSDKTDVNLVQFPL